MRRGDRLLWSCVAVSAALHAALLGLLQFTLPADPVPDLPPLHVRVIEPPAGPLTDQPPPERPEPAPAEARAISPANSRAKAPGPSSGPVGSAESRKMPRLSTNPVSPAPAAASPGKPTQPSRSQAARPAPERGARETVPPVVARVPQAPGLPPHPSQVAPAPRASPPRPSLREQLARIGRRALLAPVPGPFDAGRAGAGSVREATVALEARAHEYAAYLAQVQRRIEREWRYPRLAHGRGLTGKLVVEFTIERDGGLTRLHLADSSGVSLLDDAALAAIRRAAPYSPLPEQMGLDRLRIVASFEYLGGYPGSVGGS